MESAYIYPSPKIEVPPTVTNTISDAERSSWMEKIEMQLRQQNATLVAHYYVDADLQNLADHVGGLVSDSLEMARFGHRSEATTLVVCGVRFMGETAKILNPEKSILMPSLEAECSLDLGCPADQFIDFCDAHPERTVVVYANTSAAVKARADWMVTSGSAIKVVKHLAQKGEKIIWAPDKYLGDYIQQKTGADMLIWPGACVVHEEFKEHELKMMREHHPQAKVLVHPESPAGVISQADMVGSTTQIITAVKEMDAQEFIVATDIGIFHKIHEAAPNKMIIKAPTAGKSATCVSCGHCPWMAMNSLQALSHVLEYSNNEIRVDKEIAERARKCIKQLLDFTQDSSINMANDA